MPGFLFTLFTCVVVCSSEVDVIFILDASGSISSQQFSQVLQFVTDLVSTMMINETSADDPRVRVGILAFSNETDPIIFLNDFQMTRDIGSHLNDVQPERSRTNTHLALEYAFNTMLSTRLGNREDVPDRFVVISDGDATDIDAMHAVAAMVTVYELMVDLLLLHTAAVALRNRFGEAAKNSFKIYLLDKHQI